MEESGMGAAVEQLTTRGMEYQSPQWGAIVILYFEILPMSRINPRNGGQ